MGKLLKELFLISVTPIGLFNSCAHHRTIDTRYQNITEEGKAQVELLKSYNFKQYTVKGEKWDALWNDSFNRGDDFLDTSYTEQLDFVESSTKEALLKADPLTYGGYKTYYIEPNSGSHERVVFYFHGGAYFFNVLFPQLDACYTIANKFNARVYIPLYPVLPQHTYQDCYAFLDELYLNIVREEKNKDFIFMGDSAGGGLVLAYSQHLVYEKTGIKLPIARVCFSPWCDIATNNPAIAKKLDADICLAPYALQVVGKYWANNTKLTDYKLSPYFGKLDDKIDTIFFSGTDEILLPDVTRTCQKLTDNGCRTRLVLANGLFHVYAVFTFLPESKEALDMAYDFVINKK